ncbi:DUF1015 family protein [Poriferisphaera sp. WC338]|uniref:DUF1015 family protein n=1 Tax=Poriferisphaera sp. WC338 TaxID=3425129 RepID=UPI003D814CD5
MPTIQPIRALTYSTTTPGVLAGNDISNRIAPPYDVLDEGPKQNLLAKDPHNIVAVDLPVTPPKTVGPDTAYEAAAQTFQSWINEGIFTQSDDPAIYAYEQEYTVKDQTFKRRGIFTALGLQDFNQPNGIFRHEMTIQGGIDDRYKLMAATQSQLSPIFGIYADPKKQVANQLGDIYNSAPSFTGTTPNDNVIHRIWTITDPSIITPLQSFFEASPVYIADGHHRYTTALQYHKDNPGNALAANCLFVLVAAEDPGMIVLPTHRIITGMKNFNMEAFIHTMAKRDDVVIRAAECSADELGDLEMILPKLSGGVGGHHDMGIYDPVTESAYIFATNDADPLVKTHADKPAVWRELDVAILQHLLVDQILTPQFAPQGEKLSYKYTADINDFKSLCEEKDPGDQPRLGVIMQSTPLQSVMDVSLANEVMPPKSTYFFPKLATGLVMNPLRDV